MKHRFLSTCLMAVPLWGAPAVWAEPVDSPSSPVGWKAGVDVRLEQLLNDMKKTRDADFFSASSYLLENTGDELAFVRSMERLAAKGHPVAKYWCAIHMEPSRGGEKFLLLAGILDDYPPAIVALARLIHNGWDGCAADKWQAKVVLMDACKIGSSEARALYLMWSAPESGAVDCSQAEMASELKRHNHHLEEMLAERNGASPDADWLKEASDHGSPCAAFLMYGRLLDSSPDEAATYLRLAAERHHPIAMERLGCQVFAAADPGSAEAGHGLELLRQAAATGDNPRASALVALAYASYVMGQGTYVLSEAPDEVQRIADLFRSAHVHGDALGSIGWGYCLVAGTGCKQDAPQGLALLHEAAKTFPRLAYLALYHIYDEGIGVSKDAAKATEFKRLYAQSPQTLPAVWLFVADKASAPFFPALY